MRRLIPHANTNLLSDFEMDRRTFTFGAVAATVSLAVIPAHAGFFVKNIPHYSRNSRLSSFQGHLDKEKRTGEFGWGGVYYVFKHGIPLVSSCKGTIIVSGYFSNSGNEIQIYYGIVQLVFAHQENLFKHVGDAVDRITCLGALGDEGGGANNKSHLHFTVMGNAALQDDPYFQQRNYNGNLGKSKIDKYHKWNFVIDPERLRADNPGPLFERPYSPKIDANLDSEYLSFVAQNVRTEFILLSGIFVVSGDFDTRSSAKRTQIQLMLNVPLVEIINASMRRYEVLTGFMYHEMPTALVYRINGHLAEIKNMAESEKFGAIVNTASKFDIQISAKDDRILDSINMVEVAWLGEIYTKVREAGRLIKLTSPYIDHTNPETILAIAAANPEHVRKVILSQKFYGQFVPDEMMPEAYRGIDAVDHPVDTRVEMRWER